MGLFQLSPEDTSHPQDQSTLFAETLAHSYEKILKDGGVGGFFYLLEPAQSATSPGPTGGNMKLPYKKILCQNR